MSNKVIKVENVTKQYRLGAIGGGTLRGDLQSFSARIRGKEDPNTKIGQANIRNERFLALDDVSFDVMQGDTLGIIGHNGAGKSTMLKLLSRVTAPTKGLISHNGRIASMLEVGTGFHPELTGRENVYLNGAILGMSRDEITSKFDEIVSFAEMEMFIDTPVKRYSSGMYVKLAFAVAAHLDSEILVMDEVLAVGDMKFQQKCLGKMGDVADKEGRTVLYVSHNMNTIRQLCNRCIVLDHGKKVFDGDVEQAISVYSKADLNLLETDIDLSQKRMKHLESVKAKAKMMRIRLLGKDVPTYNADEPIDLELTLVSYANIDNYYMRIEVLGMDDVSIGAAVSESFGSMEEGEEKIIKFRFSPHELVDGKYKAVLLMFEMNEFGNHRDLDGIFPCFIFEVQNRTFIEWRARRWGSIRFDDLKLLD
ncbi:MAG: ABC transporter ATP-binding protein [Clostridiales bacterium]|jgi:lipopolysaccharide transport system ATP-binding protein|nr:ABC transporter ATP-binding protein [Clostridiales bacterium]